MQTGVAFSDQTIAVEIDANGIVHMDIPTGDALIHMAFPVGQLVKNMAVCDSALARWRRRGTAKVIPVEFDSKFERVYRGEAKDIA